MTARASAVASSTTIPAPASATRRAFSGPSTNSGTSASGTPAASAVSVEPDPPWPTTAAARGITSACATQRSTRTRRGSGPSSAGSRRSPIVSRTREVRERLDRVAVEAREQCDSRRLGAELDVDEVARVRRRDAVGGAEAVHALGRVAERAARDDRGAPDGVDVLEAERVAARGGDREQLRVGVGLARRGGCRPAPAGRRIAPRRRTRRTRTSRARSGPAASPRPRRAFPGARRARRAR